MKTTIIATIGPATTKILDKVCTSWVKRFRLNLSHWTIDWHRNIIREIKKLEKIPEIILDTKWPDIRTGRIEWEFEIKKWDVVKIQYWNTELQNKGSLNLEVDYKYLYEKVVQWSEIALDSWKVILIVDKIEWEKIITRSLSNWVITSRRHVNVPWIRIDLPILTDGDKKAIEMWIEEWVDSIAVSFVRDKNDIEKIKKIAPWLKIISKIESLEALINIDEIIDNSDEVMIARGDLWIEIPFYKLPIIETRILKKCNRLSKPVTVATQMLVSMTKNPIPTRAEAWDVATAVQFWANSVMLSEETANWEHPIEAIEAMKQIAEFVEESESVII